MPETDPYLVPKNPVDIVHSVAMQSDIPADVADDYLRLTKIESGQNVNVRNSGKGARGFGQVMPDVKGGTVRTVGGRKYDLTNPAENVEAGLRYFHEGGPDPVARRLHYFGGPKASGHYQRTGKIPNISDGNMTAAQYVKATGGEQSQDPYLVPKGTQESAPEALDDPYLVPKTATPRPTPTNVATKVDPNFGKVGTVTQPVTVPQSPPVTSLSGTTVKPMTPRTVSVGPNDAKWHFGMDLDVSKLPPKAQQVLADAVAEDERKKAKYGGVEAPSHEYHLSMARKAGLTPQVTWAARQSASPLQTAPVSIGELRQRDESAVADSAFVHAQSAKQAGARALRTNPNSAQARLYDPREDVAQTAEVEQAQASAEDEWRRTHQPEIDRKVATIRSSIRRQGGFDKWLAEFGAKAVSGLIEPAGAVSNAARVQSEAMMQAAEAEGVDRNVVSKFIQNTGAGLIGSAPEMAAMALGAPAIPTFALGGGVRAAAKGQDIPQGVIHGGLSGAAFELPIPGVAGLAERPVAKAIARGLTTGVGSTAVELGAGRSLPEAAATGATMGLMSGGGHLIHGEAKAPEVEAARAEPSVRPEAPTAETPEQTAERVFTQYMQEHGRTRPPTPAQVIDIVAGGKAEVPNEEGRGHQRAIVDRYQAERARIEGEQNADQSVAPVPQAGEAPSVPVEEPVHHSQLQPRTPEGQFDGPPAEQTTAPFEEPRSSTPESSAAESQRKVTALESVKDAVATKDSEALDDAIQTAKDNGATDEEVAVAAGRKASVAPAPGEGPRVKGREPVEYGFSETDPAELPWSGLDPPSRDYRINVMEGGRLLEPTIRDIKDIRDTEEADKHQVADLKQWIADNDNDLPPIVVERDADGFYVVDGHHRLQAARELGYTKIPVVEHEPAPDPYLAALDLQDHPDPVPASSEKGGTPKNVSDQIATPPVQAGEPAANVQAAEPLPAPDVKETGIKHSVVEAERELQGLPQFQKARRAAGVSFDEGVHAVRSGDIDPRALAIEQATASRARPLSTTESMALLYDRMRISQARKAAEVELESASKSGDEERLAKAVDKVTELQQASNYNDEADYRTGSELGRGLAIRRELIRDDYSRARVLSRAIAINKGKPLPPEVQAKYEAVVDQLAKAHERIADLETQQKSQVADAEVEKVTRQMAREVRARGTKRSVEAIKAERVSIKQNVAQAWAKQKALLGKDGTLSAGGLGNLDPEGELTRAFRDLARSYIEEGVVKAADIVDAVHEHIKDVADGITKRQVSDLISGYGRTKESTSDPIERKLNEVKSILAATSGKADVLEQGIRAARRGQQQEKPTEDQRRALRELQDAMREKGPELGQKPYDVKTEQATPLDKAKTTTRNRIEQLRKWIADGRREVQGENKTIPDSELSQLKAERAGLEKAAALLDDPAADQKAIEKRLSELSKSLATAREKGQSGNVTPTAKEGASQIWTPEIGAMSKERDALRGVIAKMRSEVAKAKVEAAEAAEPQEPFFGATGSWADYEVAAKKVLDRQKSFMVRNQKKMAELQKELARAKRGEQKAAREKPEPLPLTDEMKVAQRNANELKRQIEHLDAVTDWVNRSKFQKAGAYAAAITRFNVLSGVNVLWKIGGALTHRIGQQYLEEGAGKGWRSLLPETAEKAPRHGAGINRASEAEFWKGILSGAKEAPKIIKTGDSELSLEHGKRYPTIPTKLGTALSIPGRVHAAEKNILKVAEYKRSLELNLQKAERAGLSRSNPEVIEIAKERAYKDAEESILMGDNAFSRTLSDAQRRWPRLGRDAFKVGVPVSKVPSNYLSQAVGEYGLGLPRGLYRASPEIQSRVAKVIDGYGPEVMKRAARALRERNPGLMEKMTPEEADKTMRLLKRGTLGAVYVGLASLGLVKGGGFYSGQRKKDDIVAGDVEVGGFTIPHWAMHSPPAETAQFAATIKRDIQDAVKHHKSIPGGVAKGVWHGGKGLADQVPFLSQWVRLTDRSNFTTGEGALKAIGEQIASRVEPQIMKELAEATDREKNGHATTIPWKGDKVERKVGGFTGPFIIRVPVARQTLKIDRKKNEFVSRETLSKESQVKR